MSEKATDDADIPLATLLNEAAVLLAAAGIDDARREARLLAGWAAGTDLTGLLGRVSLKAVAARRFREGLKRRAAREPLAFITGRAGFWSLDVRVSPATLIPRADTETLIEALLELRPDRSAVRSVLDLGTGTGALLLAALAEYPQARGVGIDLSPDAALLARDNALENGLGDRAVFLCGNWAEALDARFDVVLSNPPYIESTAIPGLMPEVSRYEPERALDGGRDGLDAYRALSRALPGMLTPGGVGLLELGQGQDDAVTALGRAQGLKVVARRSDLGGIVRALALQTES
ncbi:peptide chain release factor N(5)-glutamine methyltransferase [Acidomonas methanolica]|uniref:peptide chain release factor N(5)-glutamine methyltransferase n=2 Tax=Acidomonas methanolica TaxID=437 RepID=UPI001043F3A6|nr:peptide chain release factor N(5)-glutamine methyltransferase [Acidomonas methanolica]MBU2653207.1 peptide chain release factor N(5)-glutamine methyltransferase [Acidomonas methanolica]TCS32156.1 release factor glutamine methyltransferase [Acidomonas methanolica]GBQ54870.1 modification methylase HemK [Acidomonas methanolica]GEK97590.1 release factor glutamine methyltransferase [Acidomonas methanolica NBRC 104435]